MTLPSQEPPRVGAAQMWVPRGYATSAADAPRVSSPSTSASTAEPGVPRQKTIIIFSPGVDYGGGDRGRGSKRLRSSILIDDMAQVDDESDIDDVVSGGDNDFPRLIVPGYQMEHVISERESARLAHSINEVAHDDAEVLL